MRTSSTTSGASLHRHGVAVRGEVPAVVEGDEPVFLVHEEHDRLRGSGGGVRGAPPARVRPERAVEAGERLMSVTADVAAGVRNAFARRPSVDQDAVERTLRQANRALGRTLGRIEWAGSLEAYIRRSADLMVEGWTLDDDGPLSPPKHVRARAGAAVTLPAVTADRDRAGLWENERAAHSTARLSPSRAAARVPERDRGAVDRPPGRR